MKYLGIDYGSKRVGLAVSNLEGTIAFPRTTLPYDSSLWERLQATIAQEGIESIVIGDTRALSGQANPITEEVERFAERLRALTQLPIVWAREAGSSVAASSASTKTHDDAAAAAFVLQRYLDMHGKNTKQQTPK